MSWLQHIDAVDLIVLVLLVLSFLGALRRRGGLLAGLISVAGTALFCWLAAGALIAWGPGYLSGPVAASMLAHTVPLPVAALQQAGHIATGLLGQLQRVNPPSRS